MSEPVPNAGTDLDRPMTLPEFARWLGVEEGWVRKRLRILPGVIIESREMVRVHPRTYLDLRLRADFLPSRQAPRRGPRTS